ncbi:hypothetical protein [Mesorhizobium sp. M0910]
MLEDQLTVGAQYPSVGKITRTNRSKPDEPALVDDGFDLVNVFANWRINGHAKLDFSVDLAAGRGGTDGRLELAHHRLRIFAQTDGDPVAGGNA